MARAWRRFVSWCAETEPADALAFFRIAVGLVCTAVVVTPLTDGVWPLWVDVERGGFAPPADGPMSWQWVGGSGPTEVLVLLGVMIALGIAVTLGVGGRWPALFLGQGFLVLFDLHSGTGGGHDRLITNGLWLLFLSGAHTSWSLPVKIRTGRWRSDAQVEAWPRRMGVWQLVVMYTLTGFQKQGNAWTAAGDYRALYDTFLLPSWARYDHAWWVPHVFELTQLSTIVAWWWEALFVVLPLWYWLRRDRWAHTRPGRWARRWDLRKPFVLLGFITHGVLWLTMNLGPFTIITFAFYLCLLTPADLAWVRPADGSASGEGSANG